MGGRKINTMKDTLKNQETIYGQYNEHPHKHYLANTTIYRQTSHQGHVFNTTVERVEKKKVGLDSRVDPA